MRTLKFTLGAAFLLLTAATGLHAQIPAFPGAEGFGAYATGGRGGDVYTVVNLNSSGAGSLRYGVETAPAQGRTIVFAVSGYIPISNNSDTGNKTVRIVQNKVTIAGQTAPGDGIALKDGRILVTGNNAVLRHLRIRHGKNGGAGDCLNLESSADNSIIDHVSLMFSTDENISFFNSSVDNFTMQYSTSSWGMERHSAGGLWDLQRGSCHHSLWAHHRTRNPKARPAGLLEWINNVTYHWRSEGFIMGDSTTPIDWYANVRGCYFLSIADYEFGLKNIALSKARIATDGQPNFHLYLDNCLHDANGDGLLNGTDKGYAIVDGQPYDPAEGAAAGTVRYDKALTPFAGASGLATVNVDNPLTAYKKVLSSAGALRLDATYAGALRDELDSLLVQSVENQESILVAKDSPLSADDPPSNGEAQLANPPYNISNGGFGTLNTVPAPTDTDGDGMPDFWETTLGWSAGGQDHNTAMANSGGFVTGLTFFPPNTPAGYTRLEEYLHFKASPHATLPRNTTEVPTSLSVDLRRYTRGFNKAPVTFTFSNVTNGTVVLQPDGYTAVFTPTLNYSGRARFDFTVTDGDGSAWTQTLGVLVSAVGVPRDLKWKGDGSANVWSTNAPNFLNGTNLVAFATGDNVRFDDTGSNTPAIALNGTNSPGAVVVQAAQDYTLGGSGILSGVAALAKSGPGTLTLNTANDYAGGTTVDEGALVIGSGGSVGSGPLTLAGGSATSTYGPTTTYTLGGGVVVPSGSAGTLNLSPRMTIVGLSGAGTLNLNVPGTVFNYDNFNGSFAGFTGTLNLSGTVPGALLTANFNGGSFDGNLGNAIVNLDNVTIQGRHNSFGNTLTIGALSGTASSALGGSGYAGNQTLTLGGKNLSTTFAGTIGNGVSTTSLNKVGTGTLTLTGNNTYSGATTVSAGTLLLTGNNGPSPVTVANGATLAGDGTVGGLITVNSGGKLAPGTNAVGTLAATGGVTLNSPTMPFDLSSSPAGNNDKLQMQGGLLTMSGTQTYQFNLLDGQLGAGTYTLIDGGANTSASGVGFAHNLPAGARQTFQMQSPISGNGECYVRLVVTGNPTTLVWRGLLNSNWDTTTANWLNGAAPDIFYNFDSVVVDDSSGSAPTLNFTTAVNPASVLVNVSTARTFAGAGALAGSGTLTKTGSGTLNITTTNSSFSGHVMLAGGTLNLQTNGASLSTGNMTLSGGATFNFPPSSPAYFYGGTITVPAGQSGTIYSPGLGNGLNGNLVSGDGNSVLNITGGVSFGQTTSAQFDNFNGTIHIQPGATLRFSPNSSGNTYGSLNPTFVINGALRPRNAGNTVRLGALSGTGSIEGPQSNAGSGNTTYLIGGNNLDVNFDGNISSNSAVAGSLVILNKIGTGTLTLGGGSTYTGGTTVEAGSLVVNNVTGSSTGTGALLVKAGARLGGAGFIGSSTTLEDDAILAPGTSAGTLTFNNDLTLGDFSVLEFELGSSSDTVAANGALSLAGTLNVTAASGFGAGSYTLFTYNPANTFNDSGINLGTAPAGFNYAINTSTPGQVKLVVTLPTPPSFGQTFLSGGNLIMTGSGGAPDADYYLLTSTNVALPLAQWTRSATNQFDSEGNFAVTNSVTGQPRQFFCVQVP